MYCQVREIKFFPSLNYIILPGSSSPYQLKLGRRLAQGIVGNVFKANEAIKLNHFDNSCYRIPFCPIVRNKIIVL